MRWLTRPPDHAHREFKPYSLSKTRTEDQPIFKLIMGFPVSQECCLPAVQNANLCISWLLGPF